MKKIYSLLVFILPSVIFLACSKNNGSTTGVNSANSMTASVSGKSFSTNDVTIGGDYTYLSIWGSLANSYIAVYIDQYKGAGTYPIGTQWYVPTQYSVNGQAKYAVHGTVTITATTPKIVGTFSFTCDDSTKVASGTFNAK
jgi:hypothetical protein